MGLCRQGLVGPGAGMDVEDFDNLGDVVLHGTGYVSPAAADGFDVI